MGTDASNKEYHFRGFRGPNYTQVPDEVFDELLAELSGNQLKVLMYIIRRTFGFKRESDNISINQMLYGITTKHGKILDRGVGLSKPTLLQALRDLTEMRIIIPTRRQSFENGDEPTNYRLNVWGDAPSNDENEAPNASQPRGKNSLPGGSSFFTTGVVNEPDTGVVKEFDPQETVLQDTVNPVNVKRTSKEVGTPGRNTEEQDALNRLVMMDILSVLKDVKSRGFYLKVARRVPRDIIHQLLAQIRVDIINNPHSQVQNPAAIFTTRIKELAAERE
jgi:hypothetical protein